MEASLVLLLVFYFEENTFYYLYCLKNNSFNYDKNLVFMIKLLLFFYVDNQFFIMKVS